MLESKDDKGCTLLHTDTQNNQRRSALLSAAFGSGDFGLFQSVVKILLDGNDCKVKPAPGGTGCTRDPRATRRLHHPIDRVEVCQSCDLLSVTS